MAPSTAGRLLGGLGVLVATGALGLLAGPWGLLAGLATAVAWYALPAPSAFAAGAVLALPATADAPLAAVVAVQVGLLAVLAGSLLDVDEPLGALFAFALATLALAAVGWGVLRAGRPLWLATLALALVAATAAYGLHRYERVRLGLIEEAG